MNSAGQGLPGDPYGYKPDTFEYGYPTVIKLKPCPFCKSKAVGESIMGISKISCMN